MFYVIIVFILLVLASSIRIVSESNAYVVEFLGKYNRTLEAGIHFIIPFFERVAKKVSLKEQVCDFPPSGTISKDNVQLSIDSVVYYRVSDPKLYTYGVSNPIFAIENLTATTLRNIIGELELDDTLTSRDIINGKMKEILDDATDPWGIKVTRVELKNIMPPREIQEAMEKQMRAERERRETLLEAEGHKEAVVKREEGNKAARVLEAEGRKAAAIAEAEGQAKAISLVYEAQAQGLQMLKDVVGDNGMITLKKLEALEKLGNGRATKIVVPTELTSSASELQYKGEMLGLYKTMDVDTSPLPNEENKELDECCDDIAGKEMPKIPTQPILTTEQRQDVILELHRKTEAPLKLCKEACYAANFNLEKAELELKKLMRG